MEEKLMYDAKECHISVDGRVVQGFQANDMFTAQLKEDRIRTSVDAQGTASVAINNSHLGQIVINLSGNSVDHKRLNQLANSSKAVPIVITTPYEKITSNQAICTKPANAAFGKDTPARTYTFEALDMQVDVI